MNLFNELKDAMKDQSAYGSEGGDIKMLPTGFDCFDYLNGQITELDGKEEINVGVSEGKIITVIGKSGSGKSTFALQAAYNIIKPYEQGSMFVLDFEQSNTEDRIRGITGMSKEEYDRRCQIKSLGISTETVLNTVVAIKNIKMKNKKDLMVETGKVNVDGTKEKIMVPTVIVIDSIAMMMPKEALEEEEIAGQMVATQAAKMNTQLCLMAH